MWEWMRTVSSDERFFFSLSLKVASQTICQGQCGPWWVRVRASQFRTVSVASHGDSGRSSEDCFVSLR